MDRPLPRLLPHLLPHLLPWLLPMLVLVALVETAMHVAVRAAVPQPADHAAAADFVRRGYHRGEVIAAAPGWHDPVVRQQLGDLIGLDVAGRSDLARFDGMWVLSLRGARAIDEPTGRAPDLQRSFGGVTVRHYALKRAPILYDFVAAMGEPHAGQVSLVRGGGRPPQPCKVVDGQPATGGGLGRAVVGPPRRAVCNADKPQAFVAPVVMEDLQLRPRHCIWQPALGRQPMVVTFDDVPLGKRIVLHGGLYYEHERMREGPPVQLRVRIDGKPVGQMTHRDGEGWKRVQLPTSGGRGQVTVEVTSTTGRRRGFCWEATSRDDGAAR